MVISYSERYLPTRSRVKYQNTRSTRLSKMHYYTLITLLQTITERNDRNNRLSLSRTHFRISMTCLICFFARFCVDGRVKRCHPLSSVLLSLRLRNKAEQICSDLFRLGREIKESFTNRYKVSPRRRYQNQTRGNRYVMKDIEYEI